MKRLALPLLVLALAACGAPVQPGQSSSTEQQAEAPVAHTAPAGAYMLDKPHSSLIVRLNHLGYSQFTARFETWDADLTLDPATPENSQLSVSIDPRSIASDNPPAGFIDIMRGAEFLNAAQFPAITFRSTRVERTGPNTARITGDLTLHGVTKPVTLEARFNGGYEGMPALDPQARIGLSARGVFNRSEFGMGYGVPEPSSNMGVSDAVEVIVETEFNGPALATAAATTP
jgi:polyisoprenoid-binding protein YceI